MYRQNASDTSPTLEQLAAHARWQRQQASLAPFPPLPPLPPLPPPELGRLELAIGVSTDRGRFGILALVLWISVLAALRAAATPWGRGVLAIGLLLALAATIAWFFSSTNAEARRKAAVETALRWPARFPFEVHGYAAWLASEAPTLTLTMARPIDRTLLADAARGIDPAIQTAALDATTFAIAVPPLWTAKRCGFGDRVTLERLFEQLLLPLHADIGIVRVVMEDGGRR